MIRYFIQMPDKRFLVSAIWQSGRGAIPMATHFKSKAKSYANQDAASAVAKRIGGTVVLAGYAWVEKQ